MCECVRFAHSQLLSVHHFVAGYLGPRVGGWVHGPGLASKCERSEVEGEGSKRACWGTFGSGHRIVLHLGEA